MRLSIEQVIERAEKELKQGNSYAYLPGIIESLKEISKTTNNKKLHKLLGGLFRLVTDNFKFERSKLGQDILKSIEIYYKG